MIINLPKCCIFTQFLCISHRLWYLNMNILVCTDIIFNSEYIHIVHNLFGIFYWIKCSIFYSCPVFNKFFVEHKIIFLIASAIAISHLRQCFLWTWNIVRIFIWFHIRMIDILIAICTFLSSLLSPCFYFCLLFLFTNNSLSIKLFFICYS